MFSIIEAKRQEQRERKERKTRLFVIALMVIIIQLERWVGREHRPIVEAIKGLECALEQKKIIKLQLVVQAEKLPDCRQFQAREHVVKRQFGARLEDSDLFRVSRVARRTCR